MGKGSVFLGGGRQSKGHFKTTTLGGWDEFRGLGTSRCETSDLKAKIEVVVICSWLPVSPLKPFPSSYLEVVP